MPIWSGRIDDATKPERYHQRVTVLSPEKLLQSKTTLEGSFALIGFSSDEGVRRNGGRIGAAQGPRALRQALGGLAHPPTELYDVGDITVLGRELEKGQRELGTLVAQLQAKGLRTLVFGGGHETAYGHFLGLPQKGLGILNFDAHFDLRPLGREGASSGTPFSQIAEQMGKDFAYSVIGIQENGNTAALFARAKEWGCDFVLARELHEKGLQESFALIDRLLARSLNLYITVCLDVIAEAYAPGVSAPQPLGLRPDQLLTLLRYVFQKRKPLAIDFVELAPPLDRANQTARLAAAFVAEVLRS